MTTILKTREWWILVEDGVPVQPDQNVHTPEVVQLRNQWKETSMKDMMALQLLQTAVSESIFSRIAPSTTSKDAWEALESEYQGTPQVRLIKLQSLRREYENLKMNERDDIKVFTEKLIDLANQLRVHGEVKTDYQLVQKILISLPTLFDSIVSVMEETKDLTTLSVTELIGTLKAHEARLSARDESTNEGAFNACTKARETGFKRDNTKSHGNQGRKWCEFCKKSNHTENECWSKPKQNDQGKNKKSNIKCYNCGRIGHYSNECRSKEKEMAQVSLEEEDSSDEDHMLFSASEAEEATTKEDVWLVDSGCTNRMTREERYFSKIDKSIKVPIKIGNREVVMTTGKGDIIIMTKNGKKIIQNVFLAPDLEKNLLSVPQMISSGYRVSFEDKKCIIRDAKGKKIMESSMTHKSFKIKLKAVQEEAAEIIEECLLVHEEPQTYNERCIDKEWRKTKEA